MQEPTRQSGTKARADVAAADAPPERDAAPPELPRMPAASTGEGLDPRPLRRFHLTGERLAGEESPSSPLMPVALAALLAHRPDWKLYPLVVAAPAHDVDGTEAISLHDLLARELAALAEAGEQASVLAAHLEKLVRGIDRQLRRTGGTAALRPAFRDACTALSLQLGPQETSALEREAQRLAPHLPESSALYAAGPGTLPALYVRAVDRRRRKVTDFRGRVEASRQRLVELLRVDRKQDPDSMEPGAISDMLGAAADGFVSPELLSTNVPRPRGPRRLAPERRERIERAVAELSAYLDGGPSEHDLLIVQARPPVQGLPAWARSIRDDNPLGAAVELFDEIAQRLVATLRACHVARLEADNRYEPALHDALLAPLHWRDLPDEDLLLMPVVAAIETADRIRRQALAEFSTLMQSRRPLHVLIEEPCRSESDETGAEDRVSLGYLAVAHREVFVLQSTLARPVHLFSGLARLAASPRPAAAIVATAPQSSSLGSIAELDSALTGRATPCYCYDAAAGTSWADRFDTDGNPDPASHWPTVRFRFLGPDDTEREKAEVFTFAHAAAVDPAYRDGFRVIGAAQWSDEQLEIGDYLELPADQRPGRLPFVWVSNGEGKLARAVATRRVVLACRDRLRAWRVYQELAGTDNAYVERAAREARRAALEEATAEQERLVKSQAEELEQTRIRAADLAVERLVGALIEGRLPLGGDAAVTEMPIEAPVGRAPESAAPAVEPEPEEQPDDELDEGLDEELTFDEPCIDSAMCTTCNDCTKINPRMFKYNEDQQAYIADANAGTFEQLVRAAEKCPARCIHPGRPRVDDKTATAKMIERAAPFNQ